MEAIKNRYDFVILFDVENGNPNGDPDSGNMPRIDPETGYGLVTDVCLKRKIRNYVETIKEGESGYRIYIKDNVPLNRSDREAYDYLGIEPAKVADAKKKKENLDLEIRDFMCKNFYDIRTFGAVMTTFVKDKLNCGQVRGPVQLSFAKSVDPIMPQEVTITRVAITTEADAEKKGTEMGRKYIVPYALYRAEGYVSANLARKTTGFSEEDLELLWQAIMNMLCCKIERGALFYGMPRRRMEITFTDELRKEVLEAIAEMHDMYSRGYTPKVKPTKSCAACSLNELCLPSLMKKRSVGAYIRAAMEEIT